MYLDGKGVEEDDEQAMIWYQKAADQGMRLRKKILQNAESMEVRTMRPVDNNWRSESGAHRAA